MSLNKQRKPRLLMLTSSFPRRPEDETCGYIREFARSLSSEFEVQVLTLPDRDAGKWPPDAFSLARSPAVPKALQASEDLNDLLSRGPLVTLGSCLSLACFFLTALRLALRADVICSHWLAPSGLVGGVISRLLGKPQVLVEHSGALHLLGRLRGGRLVARFVVSASGRIITVSDDLSRKLVALCPGAAERVDVVPMGVHQRPASAATLESISSTPEFQGGRRRHDHRTILFIGRLTEIKGLDVLLKAMRGLEHLELLVAGDGPLRCELETMARQLAVKAKFLGRVSAAERDELFVCTDAVVIPSRVLPDSRTEGMPLVCLEALTAGRPVIAARAGGLAELIDDGENGLLFDPGDDSMLTSKLKLVLNDSALRKRISANARLTAATLSWSQTGPRFCEIVSSVLKTNEPNIYDQECDPGQAGA
ncbi:MAG: glycosyltransferase family 4 protein [Blastocatellia bacterium]